MDQNTRDVLVLGLGTLTSLFTAWLGYLGLKIKAKVNELEKNTNSITERLGDAKFAAGKAEGRQEEREGSP